jgi:hypothetical protein
MVHPDNRMASKQLSSITRAFTEYYLHYPSQLRDQLLTCFPHSQFNKTEQLLATSIHLCPNDKYHVRRVSRSQISWKQSTSDGVTSNTTRSTSQDRSQGRNKNTSSEKIHKYLSFSLILPNHPFSDMLEKTLSQVGPMFPQVAIIVGDAYDFADVATRYLVQSYPTTLMFKNGIFVGDYGEGLEVVDLAAQLAIWTRSLPQSTPPRHPAHTPLEQGFEVITISSPTHWSVSSFLPMYSNITIMLPVANLEPFQGTFANFLFLDRFFFLVCGLYVVLRLGRMLWSFNK